jgi:hypothetical protein
VNIIPKSNAWVKRKRSLHSKESEEAVPAKTDETPDIEPIVVLDLIMPNGKRMRDCTGADMKKFGDLLLKRRESLLKRAEQPKT